MKKTTIIIIGLIYFISIILVGVYGLQYKQFNQIVPVTSVTVINPDYKIAKDPELGDVKTYFVYKNEETGLRQFQIDWRVEPIETATNKNVRFIYTSDFVTINSTGLVESTRKGSVNITVVPDDNSDCKDVIKIYFMD